MANEKQRTLAQPATLAGKALHTGADATLTLRPGPEGAGISFRRMDLPDQPFIKARADRVQTVERATTLAEGGVKVHTVEHVISALAGMGVDNAIVEMDANEPPIGDGSALPYVQCIKEAGIIEQDALRPVFEVRETIHCEAPGGAFIAVLPERKFRISCAQAGPDGRFSQFLSLEITPEIYEKEIAPARTFVYYEDVEPLLQKGLIKGGSLENAVVIRGDSVMSKEPMRFPDEFVRHKILDVIGDLMLCGRSIMGHVIALRPGHGANTLMARKLADARAAVRALAPPVNIPIGEGALDTTEILRILPHRYPFLLVDRIVGFDGDNRCTGVKNLTMNELFFQGHFPDHPVMPGVLQVEAMAQVASIVLLRKPENQGKIGYFMSADNVKFRRPVRPGDSMFIEAEILKVRRTIGQAQCRCLVNGQVVSEGLLKFNVMDR